MSERRCKCGVILLSDWYQCDECEWKDLEEAEARKRKPLDFRDSDVYIALEGL